jgi:deazaflavin-dependent oxidoreductase (nitroreductase family)
MNGRVRAINALMSRLTRLGVVPHTYLLEVRGARSGELRTVPVTLVENGDRYLVAPYGERAWVRNVRANPNGRLIRGGRAVDVRFEEVGLDEAAPVLQRYWRWVPNTRPYFGVGGKPDLEDFRRTAPQHPVFRVIG